MFDDTVVSVSYRAVSREVLVMQYTHVYEIVGQVLFRRSGNGVRTIVDCTIVRTRATAWLDESGIGAKVQISAITTGYETLHFASWILDWHASDNADRANGDFQSGRPIDIAIPTAAFNAMVETGQAAQSYPSITDSMRDRSSSRRQGEPFHSPVAAVRIDGRWVEPDSRI